MSDIEFIKKEARELTDSIRIWITVFIVALALTVVFYCADILNWLKLGDVGVALLPIAFILALVSVILSSVRSEITAEYLARELSAVRKVDAVDEKAVDEKAVEDKAEVEETVEDPPAKEDKSLGTFTTPFPKLN